MKKDKPMTRNCFECKHAQTKRTKLPCKNCHGWDHYKPKNEES